MSAYLPSLGCILAHSNYQLQLNPVVRRVRQVLLRPEVPLDRLYRRVAQQQLNLLQFANRGPAQFRRRTTEIVWGNIRKAAPTT
jgi:hypothetical protein